VYVIHQQATTFQTVQHALLLLGAHSDGVENYRREGSHCWNQNATRDRFWETSKNSTGSLPRWSQGRRT